MVPCFKAPAKIRRLRNHFTNLHLTSCESETFLPGFMFFWSTTISETWISLRCPSSSFANAVSVMFGDAAVKRSLIGYSPRCPGKDRPATLQMPRDAVRSWLIVMIFHLHRPGPMGSRTQVRVIEPAPAIIGDVQQAVVPPSFDDRTVLGDVLPTPSIT